MLLSVKKGLLYVFDEVNQPQKLLERSRENSSVVLTSHF